MSTSATSPATSNLSDAALLPTTSLLSQQEDTPATTSQGAGSGPGRKRKAPSSSSRGVANLTPDQLAKKRANDREAQRAIRRRTKTQIEALEKRVQELTSQQPYQDLQQALQLKQETQAENDEFRRRLAAVIDILQPVLNSSTASVGKDRDTSPPPPPLADFERRQDKLDSDALESRSWLPPMSTTTKQIPDLPSLASSMDFPALSAERRVSDFLPRVKSSIEPAAAVPTHNVSSFPAQVTLETLLPPSLSNASSLAGLRSGALHHGISHSQNYDPAWIENQKRSLMRGLDFSGPGERLGLNFLLDPSRQVPRMYEMRRSSVPPPHTTAAGPAVATTTTTTTSSSTNTSVNVAMRYRPFHYAATAAVTNTSTASSSIPGTPLDDHPPAIPHSLPIRNLEPTCTLDGVLLGFLRSRQREVAAGASSSHVVGPPYPSVSSLLNPATSVYSHPLSRVFTDILSKFPDISGLPEQVAVLYVMFLLMRWQIYPTQENYDRLPGWLTPRTSQLFTPHPAWMDYLPWPRMRDKMIASYESYDFSNWFIPYTTTLSLNWGYEGTDALLAVPVVGGGGGGPDDPANMADELMINPVFERHLRNLDNWSLGPAFARTYPDLVDTTRIKPDHL